VFEGIGVIVTGGNSGIGLATAKAFVRRGAHVGIVGRTPEKLASAKSEIEAVRANASQIVATARADVSDWEQAHRALESLVREGLDPQILVNSAGVIVPGQFDTMSVEEFDHNVINDFDTVVNMCRAVVPLMVERQSGHIVNVSSVAGYLGIYGYTAYAAAKYAVMGFTEALRFEMKPQGVRVSVVCPPDTDTPMLAYEKTLRPPETEKIAGNIKAIPPERVGDAIVRGVEKNKYYIIPDFTSRLYFRLKGLWPELFFSIVDGNVRQSRKERGLS
jgi:3-dehydrosphinganine reductase